MATPGILKTYAGFWSALLQLVDLLVVLFSGLFAGWWYLSPVEFHSTGYLQLMTIGLLLSGVLFHRVGAYESRRGGGLFDEIRSIGLAWVTVVVALSVFVFFTKSGIQYSRIWALLWFALGLVGLVCVRTTLRLFLRQLRRLGHNQRQIIVIGYPDLTQEITERFRSSVWLGLHVRESIHIDELSMPRLVAAVESGSIDQVWIALPLKEEARLKTIFEGLAMTPVEIKYVPDLFGFRLFSHSLSDVDGLPVLNLCSTPMQGLNRLIKAVEDFLLSVVFLILLAPLMLLISLGIKLTSPGPVFFKQARLGWGGKKIDVLKFRSMVVHTEADGVLTQATKNDSRVTPFGAFLRRTSLDELPQFINVLRGDMSIVGPRPHALAHNDQFKDLVDDYMLRHRVKPGITGWAQVNGYRGETDTLIKMQKRVEYDLYYIEHWSVWLDLKILFMTIFKGFVNKNAY